MILKKEYRDILNNLDPGERKAVNEILERVDAATKDDKFKSKWNSILHTIQNSLKRNFTEWFMMTYIITLSIMIFLTLHDIRCLAIGDGNVLNQWYFEFYLYELHGHNLFYGLFKIIICAGKFSIGVYIAAWVYSMIGFFLLGKMKNSDWDNSRNILFNYLNNREQYANMKGFNAVSEREEMEKWANTNPNYHYCGVAINKNK